MEEGWEQAGAHGPAELREARGDAAHRLLLHARGVRPKEPPRVEQRLPGLEPLVPDLDRSTCS